MASEYIINVYVKLIKLGEKQLSDVPEGIRTEVGNKLNESNTNVN